MAAGGGAWAVSARRDGAGFTVATEDGSTFTSRRLLVTTFGARIEAEVCERVLGARRHGL